MKEVIAFYNTYKIFVYPATVGLASMILIIFTILPQVNSFIKSQETLQVSEEKLRLLEAKAAELDGLNGQDINKKLDTVLGSLPSDKDFPSLMGQIQNLALSAGLTLSSISLGQLQSANGVSGFIVKVEVIGPSSSLKNFLSSVEKAHRAMKVSGIEISSSKDSGAVDALVTIDVFYSPIPTTLGALDQPLPKLSANDEKIISNLSKASTAGVSATPILVPRGKANPFE
jgi:Tfp pilus assembly protein PilO